MRSGTELSGGDHVSDDERVVDENGDEFFVGPLGEKISRRQALKASLAVAGAAAAGPLIFTSKTDAMAEDAKKKSLPYKANTNVKGTVQFWHHWASPLRHGSIRQIIAAFEKEYPHIKVKDTAFPFGDVWTKNVAAVAAGQGMPDVLISNRPTLWYDGAQHKVYSPLTSLAKADGLQNGKAWWPAPWAQCTFKNNVWGLPFELDCRVLYWNRALFQDKGLNPNKGPVTWQDAQNFSQKLESINNSPNDVVGFYPTWGNSMSVDGWVWTDGGDDQDKKMHPTLNSAKMVQTGDWMQWFGKRYPSSVTNSISSLNKPGLDQFGSAHAGMEVHIPGQQAVWNFYGVSFVNAKGVKPFPYWGVGLVPHATGHKSVNFTGGFSLSMPTNHHRSKANTAATWEFIKYMSLVGQRTWSVLTQAIPVVENTAKHDTFLNNIQHWKIFLQAVALGDAGDRNTHDVNFPGDVTGPATNDILAGKDVKATLDAAQAQALKNMNLGS
jgi:multiple sugar transport system substrate-binding protein